MVPVNYINVKGSLDFVQPLQAQDLQVCETETVRQWRCICTFWLLHQLRLVYICNPALQLLRMFREKLEFGAITFRMLPRVIIPNLSWRKERKKLNVFTDIQS